MGLFIQKAGVLDTIQDLGRIGSRRSGINPNGVMDQNALRLINILLGNPENEGAIEMHFPASEFVFKSAKTFALGGANFEAALQKEPLNRCKIYSAKKGDVLTFRKKINGNRCYLAVAGGLEIEKWLDSKSTNLLAQIGGYQGRKLMKGDTLNFRKVETSKSADDHLQIAGSLCPRFSKYLVLRITAGAEYRRLTAKSELAFFEQSFNITNDSNRMGYRLESAPLYLLNDAEILSTAVNFGTIQLLPNGQMVVLMADHQTTGGYPRIAHIVETDLSKLAQCGPGDSLSFELISLREAEIIRETYERDLSFLRMGVKFRSGKL